MPAQERIAVVGAGIVGLAVARELRAGAGVTVFEKEAAVGLHQTTRNSGVVHAGLYYTPGSLKARLCRRGATLMREYCRSRSLPFDECGKLVVAVDESELARLDAIEERARAAGVPALRRLRDARALRSVEPHVAGIAALHSPSSAICDFGAVARSLAGELQGDGAHVVTGERVRAVRDDGDGVEVAFDGGRSPQRFDRAIVCAGLYSDRIAMSAGGERAPAIVPFRGEYLRVPEPRASELVRGLIYPVPEPRAPFLGVHFTRRVGGGVDVGPNAVLALAREGYRRRDVRIGDVLDALGYAGTRRLLRTHWRMALAEVWGSLSRRAYVARARRLVPELRARDLVPAPAGVRAQALDPDGALVDDFRIGRHGRVIAVRNAPSPAATASLAIAEHIVSQL